MKRFEINLQNPVCKDFLGFNAVYHGYASLPDDAGRTYSDEWCDLEADRAAESGLKIARTFYSWYAYESATKTWNWDNEKSLAFYKWLQRMKDRNIDVALSAGWWCPKDINKVGYSPFAVEGDWQASVNNYANWVSEVVHQLVELRGFSNIKYLIIMTEPSHFNIANGKPNDPNQTPADCFGDCIKAAHEALISDGRRHLVKFVGPNEAGNCKMMAECYDRFDEYIDIYSAHNYQTTNLVNLRDTGPLAHSGKFAVTFKEPGHKVSQVVHLKANTDYKCAVWLKLFCDDWRTITGYVQYGVFRNQPFSEEPTGFTAGGMGPTERLTQYSVKSVESNDLSPEWQRFEFTFHNDEEVDAKFGVYRDVRDYKAILVMDEPFIAEVGCEENLLKAADFVDTTHWFNANAYPTSLDCGEFTKSFAELCKSKVKNGKPFWYDELNCVSTRLADNSKDEHGTDLARCLCSAMNGGSNNILQWTIFDQIWPNSHGTNNDSFFEGDHRCGNMPNFHRSLVPYKSYYANALICNFFGGEGVWSYNIEPNDFIWVGVNKFPDGNLSVIAVNCKYEADSFSIDFGEKLNLKLHRRVFNPEVIIPDEKAELIKSDKTFELKDVLSDEIPPYSFAVYSTIEK